MGRKMYFWLWLPGLVLALGCAESPAITPEESLEKWSVDIAPDSPSGTHQYLAEQAIGVLEKFREDPRVEAVLAILGRAECRPNLLRGLFSADRLGRYNQGREDLPDEPETMDYLKSRPTFASHFYDPDTGKNWLGQGAPTARTEAVANLERAKAELGAGQLEAGCFDLGVAMHYAGDLAQPSHAALFTARSFPVRLHNNLETYAKGIMRRYTLETLRPGFGDEEQDAVLVETAVAAKALWPLLREAVNQAYRARGCWIWNRPMDNPRCWQGDAGVDQRIGESLILAQEALARFLLTAALPPLSS